MMLCPICNYGWELSPLEFRKYKRRAKINLDFISGEISTEKYEDMIHELKIFEEKEKQEIEELKEKASKRRFLK